MEKHRNWRPFYMKSFFSLLFLIPTLSFAQMRKDLKNCPCTYVRSIEYPKKARDNNICGTVIVEIEVDSLGIQRNPRVTKGLGYGCDEAALKAVSIDIVNRNECKRKCGLIKQQPEKLNQVITFQCLDKEYIEK
jgi:hypothetical protein